MAKRLYGFRAEDCKARVWRKSLRAKLSLQDGQSDKVAKPWRRVSPMGDTGPISMALSETMADGRQGRLKRASTTCSVSRAAAPPGGPAVLVFLSVFPSTPRIGPRETKRGSSSEPMLQPKTLSLHFSICACRRLSGPSIAVDAARARSSVFKCLQIHEFPNAARRKKRQCRLKRVSATIRATRSLDMERG